MGMNIYTLKKDGNRHIGKRWANGVWCWDCRMMAERNKEHTSWFCPGCNQKTLGKTLRFNPAMRELGFDKTKSQGHRGIDGASGWVWCTDSQTGVSTTIQGIKDEIEKLGKVRTEYGDIWSAKKFEKMFLDVIEEKESPYEFS